MKNYKNILVVVLLVVIAVIFSGCVAQDGGSDTKILGWDENGPYALKHKTNGFQATVGKDIEKINRNFNDTTQQKHQQSFVEKLAEGRKPVIKSASDVTTIMSAFSTTD